MTETNKTIEPITIKFVCKKYKLSHRALGILMGYHRDHIQGVNTGRYKITDRFKTSLERTEKLLKYGDIKIPE